MPDPLTPESFNKEAINELPLRKYQGLTYVLHTQASAQKALKRLTKESVIGFDTETRPSFRKGEHHPTALLQLATKDAVYLLPLPKPECLTWLIPVLEQKNILKVGVAINDDIKHLQALKPFNPQGFLDMSELCKPLGIKHTGLRNLAGIFLRMRISKTAQTSNWARNPLTLTQITYAATDAWVSRELYLTMHARLMDQS